MTSSIFRLLLPTICFSLLSGLADVNAQVLQNSAQKIRSHKNVSYTDIVRTKFSFQEDFSADTLKSHLMLVPEEPLAGGYYHVKGSGNSYAFDGNKMVSLNLADSTYSVQKESVSGQNTRTLLHWIREMDKLTLLPAEKIKQLQDTVINNIAYANIRVTNSDTIKNNEHHYSITNFIIDKESSLPLHIITQLRGSGDDGSIFGFTETHTYSSYNLNQKDFPDLSVAIIPDHFKVPVKRTPVKFLPNGTPAPEIKAYDLSGNILDLEKLKGKIILLNFSLIGCPHCVAAAQMLNRLNDKYKDRNLEIVNIYPIDQKEAIVKFDKRENVKTSSYTSEKAVQKIYPYDGYPSFYLLDKRGVVVGSYDGYYKDLESRLAEKIESIDK